MTVPVDPRPEPAMLVPPPPPAVAVPHIEPPVAVDALLRAFGAVLAFAGGVATAALAVLLVPLRVGSFGWGDGGGIWGVRIPVAIIVAVVANLFLVWFARRATGVRWAALLPGIGWFVVIVFALRTTTEGDRLLMPDDWVGTLTLFGGTIVLVITTVLAVTSSRRRPVGRPAPRDQTLYHRSS